MSIDLRLRYRMEYKKRYAELECSRNKGRKFAQILRKELRASKFRVRNERTNLSLAQLSCEAQASDVQAQHFHGRSRCLRRGIRRDHDQTVRALQGFNEPTILIFERRYSR